MVQVSDLPQSGREGWSCKARNLLPGGGSTANGRAPKEQEPPATYNLQGAPGALELSHWKSSRH